MLYKLFRPIRKLKRRFLPAVTVKKGELYLSGYRRQRGE